MAKSSLFKLLFERLKTAKGRLVAVLACYAVLLAIALYVLLPARSTYEQYLVWTIVAVFVLLFVKTMKHSEDDSSE
jgi:hypothetical protein